MSTRTPKLPGPDHPITIEPTSERFVVRAGDTVIADSTNALLLREANYPPIPYVPLSDIDPELLQSSDTHTYCPYKGEASYYSLRTGDGVIEDALWFYDEPYEAVGEIAGHAAFYADKVSVSGD
jgi:uncharacterized protein (DUF427 family)